MKNKLTLIDYIIIILVIGAVIFAFIHVSSDDSSKSESTSYDSSTLNKIAEKYLTYYRQGFIVDTTVHGFNSTDGKPVTLHGNIEWMDDDRGTNVKVLINVNGTRYLAGLYNNVHNADIYIDSITLEMNGEKYNNLTEITVKSENITSINDLISGIGNDTDYEITATVAMDLLDTKKFQEISNNLFENNGRISIKGSNTGLYDQISIVRGTSQDLAIGNSVLGDFNGITGEITIRIYNCSESDVNLIKNNYDVVNIQKF